MKTLKNKIKKFSRDLDEDLFMKGLIGWSMMFFLIMLICSAIWGN
jgi:hypothetical protein